MADVKSKRQTAHPLRAERRARAALRLAVPRTMDEADVRLQMELLDERLGTGIGAVRERGRLSARLAEIQGIDAPAKPVHKGRRGRRKR